MRIRGSWLSLAYKVQVRNPHHTSRRSGVWKLRQLLWKYESVLDLLRSHLNGYAYQGLSKPDAALFERLTK